MNIPNILTLFRMFLIPIFVIIFFSNIKNNLFYSICIFLLAGITDILDGYIARKYNLITKWGIVLDPLADKLMLLTVLFCLSSSNIIPTWILIIVSLKEFVMIIVGGILYNKDFIIPSNKFGKLSTFMFYISIFFLIFNKDLSRYLLNLSVAIAIVTFLNYLLIYIKKKKNIKEHSI
ncbi:CDP-diacylglycerol--glycerol-3-phosphate 3-phosphatidyltransferase [Clostridium cochlearium]|uniref:CDP-diacylglycerol--glycerol-3-phosphate 3-phosphatidyltransferase n=1 Tax=Clostridium cochlearium TaxID=1494 RepID=A0A240B404_CLOCO|nr:CDP-diacylglycerol--glycerol-3-phosphate 3-phosphatidyltransferase [Clostridium cochlearium]MBE6065628.1 CDP-diacylglycerol--glycerol-3-phosphate 3-phosphatidyltransferase [Clostridium cochlearium]MBU5270219.1 CDP-diacylglycerol--glycerol-3-phosphate 3-phosphatidyltransferase [Clostridium cochlearium]MCR1972091.1 CDP-diacylglycerol--glycerol-3-phosphate 3-phosphatidyltransferase [Clostridium cochlearium]MDU1443855.1 CDP-diacylglycerol--glycerol-3-phosphate 3-phosphatidyltransferase [Clostrid